MTLFPETLIAIFLLGVFAGGLFIHLVYAHMHRTRRELVRVTSLEQKRLADTEAQTALARAFVSAVERTAGSETAGGVERKLRAVE